MNMSKPTKSLFTLDQVMGFLAQVRDSGGNVDEKVRQMIDEELDYGYKECSLCHFAKTLDKFYKKKNGKPVARCKKCTIAKTTEHYRKNGYPKRKYKPEQYKKHRERILATHKRWRDKKKKEQEAKKE